MTQEHREDFLATEGWQKTERGHIRVETFFAVPDDPYAPPLTRYYITSFQARKSRKFRRFPFGRQPKHDALTGCFVFRSEDDMVNFGGLSELNEMANKAGAYRDVPDGKTDTRVEVTWSWKDFVVTVPTKNSPINLDLIHPYGNKRQGWDKYGEVVG